jgi:hypothetical protein
MQQPQQKVSRLHTFARAYLMVFGAHVLLALILFPASALCQTSGTAPVFGKAAPGQSASGVEGTVEQGINYIANVIGPLSSAGFFVASLVVWHNGGQWGKPALTGLGLLGVSQLTRLAEAFVNNGKAGIQ